MKTIIILMLFCITSAFSQKLWEIQVNPDDLLRDVKEIPNSDLLLFTYNTGKLEIRRSEDGSLFKNVTTPQGEVGSYNISGLGNSYYFSERAEYMKGKEDTYINDTIFIYDLFSDEIINKISFDIGDYKDRNNFMSKYLTYNFTPDMTKVFGKVGYFFNNGPGDQYFYVYDLNQQKILYTEIVNRLVISEHGQATNPGFYLDSYRPSPDSKYIILNGKDNGDGRFDEPISAAKMFNVESNEMSILMTNKNTDNDKLGALTSNNTKFISNFKLITSGYKIYDFPNFNLIKSINLFADYGLHSVLDNESSICNNNLFCRVGERIKNTQNKFYYYHIFLNYDDKNIILNTKNLQISLEFSRMFLINNCQNLIVVKDFDNREGIISCYDFNTLNVENINSNVDYFKKVDNNINFNSQDFISQTANIEIFNSAGNKVGILFNGVINQPHFNFYIPELSSGTYYLQCQLPNQNLNFNFVVVR